METHDENLPINDPRLYADVTDFDLDETNDATRYVFNYERWAARTAEVRQQIELLGNDLIKE